jgi:hypothetical protein
MASFTASIKCRLVFSYKLVEEGIENSHKSTHKELMEGQVETGSKMLIYSTMALSQIGRYRVRAIKSLRL